MGRPKATCRLLHRCVHIPCQQTLVHRSCTTPQTGDAPAKCGSHQLPAAAPQQAQPLDVSHQASQLALLLVFQGNAQADRVGSIGCMCRQNRSKPKQCPMPHLRTLGSQTLDKVGRGYSVLVRWQQCNRRNADAPASALSVLHNATSVTSWSWLQNSAQGLKRLPAIGTLA